MISHDIQCVECGGNGPCVDLDNGEGVSTYICRKCLIEALTQLSSPPTTPAEPVREVTCGDRYDHRSCPADGKWHPLPQICELPRGHDGPHATASPAEPTGEGRTWRCGTCNATSVPVEGGGYATVHREGCNAQHWTQAASPAPEAPREL